MKELHSAVLFDLDGVIVSTDEYHYRAWKRLADEQGIAFDRETNQRLRGVSRMQSLEIVLEKSNKTYTQEEKNALAAAKNKYYREILNALVPDDILPGALFLLTRLKSMGIKTAIASSSKNAPLILHKVKLENAFDAVADGNEITKSKPDPEIFLLAASKLAVQPKNCVVVEDAKAGLEAAHAGGMKAVGVCASWNSPLADYAVKSLDEISLEKMLE